MSPCSRLLISWHCYNSRRFRLTPLTRFLSAIQQNVYSCQHCYRVLNLGLSLARFVPDRYQYVVWTPGLNPDFGTDPDSCFENGHSQAM